VPGDEEPPSSEVLTALVASLRRELAGAVAALGQARSELAQARERIAELETRLKQNPRKLLQAAVGRGTGQSRHRDRGRCGRKAAASPAGRTGMWGRRWRRWPRPDREIRHEPGCCGRCWAAQAAEALTAMQDLVREAISQGRDAVDPAMLAAQIRLYRSAVMAGTSRTAARSGPLMKKHHALAGRRGHR
jgi:hypothetical protein